MQMAENNIRLFGTKQQEQMKLNFFFLIARDDISHEEECIRNPFVTRNWLRYVAHKQDSVDAQFFIYERALVHLPGSYKLWKAYLDLRISQLLTISPPQKGHHKKYSDPCIPLKQSPHPLFVALFQTFRHALVYCNKYPVIWLMYARCTFYTHSLSETRHIFDQALRSLPTTQHPKIWQYYLHVAKLIGGETCIRVYKRYLKLEYDLEIYLDMCTSIDPPRYLEAAKTLAIILETPNYISKNQTTLSEFWEQLCDLIVDHAEDLTSEAEHSSLELINHLNPCPIVNIFNVERILRYGIKKYPEQAGVLWNALAKWFLLQGDFDATRRVYEESIGKVMTVKDFTIIFDAYSEFEESLLSLFMSKMDDEQLDNVEEEEIDERLAHLEALIERRPFLVNDVLLRQNPHNVNEWESRVKLYVERNNQEKIVQTYESAISTIHPKKVSGSFAILWTQYAIHYEALKDITQARLTFEKATEIQFKNVEELAEIWCQYAEFEIRHQNYNEARIVMGRATAPPPIKNLAVIDYRDTTLSSHTRLFKSLKLWSLYVDLEESIGSVETTRQVYDRILTLKIANPQILINFAEFLSDNAYHEDAYKIYERGIDLFKYPVAFDIFSLYITRFIARYGGTKIERTRDLFEQALDKCPPKYARELFVMYGKVEEEHGIVKNAMRIYERAVAHVDKGDLKGIFDLYLAKAHEYFGVISTRGIYEKAIRECPDDDARTFASRFVEMEIAMGEVDRARGVYAYISAFTNPGGHEAWWKHWQEFEVKYGNEDTFKEMLRIKRSVAVKYDTDLRYVSASIMKGHTPIAGSTGVSGGEGINPMATLEGQKEMDEDMSGEKEKEEEGGTRVIGFVRAKTTEKKIVKVAADDEKEVGQNPDEIVMDASDDEESDEREIGRVHVPSTVFGALKEVQMEEVENEMLGAKDRFKRKRNV